MFPNSTITFDEIQQLQIIFNRMIDGKNEHYANAKLTIFGKCYNVYLNFNQEYNCWFFELSIYGTCGLQKNKLKNIALDYERNYVSKDIWKLNVKNMFHELINIENNYEIVNESLCDKNVCSSQFIYSFEQKKIFDETIESIQSEYILKMTEYQKQLDEQCKLIEQLEISQNKFKEELDSYKVDEVEIKKKYDDMVFNERI